MHRQFNSFLLFQSEAKSHPSEISTCEDPTEEMYDPPKRYEKEVIFED